MVEKVFGTRKWKNVMREASLCWEILEILPANAWTEEHKKGQGRWRKGVLMGIESRS